VFLAGCKNSDPGLSMSISDLPRLSNAQTRSVSPEHFTGEKGKGGMATEGMLAGAGKHLGGQGWKVSPCVSIDCNQTFVLADIKGPGAVQHIWMTASGDHRLNILRVYWDGETSPSIECPVGDFFASAMGPSRVNSLAVCVNPFRGFNCYWQMPFRKCCKITMTNMGQEQNILFYQVDYTLTRIPRNMGYFHAQFNRVNPVPYKQVYTILDGVRGKGHYVGTYMTWDSKNPGWWGEGEIKFFLDGDKDFPTICGTGTEDYFCGACCYYKPGTTEEEEFCTPYAGLPKAILNDKQRKYGLYRWHITDPIRFEKDLKVTIQALGWQKPSDGGGFLPLQDDISSVAFWYQTEPHAPFVKLPGKDQLKN
jgi:hypothetical protein